MQKKLIYLISLAGMPTIVFPSSKKLRVTTALAPILQLEAIVIGPIILAPVPIVTLFPIIGAFDPELSFTPTVTSPKI
nr:hypothetical protein [Limosilactobacillus reuteri]